MWWSKSSPTNKKGREADHKLREYARMRIAYYAIYDPLQLVQPEDLQVYELYVSQYVPQADNFLQKIGLELVLWDGVYEAKAGIWLRWRDANGDLLATGAEAAQAAQERAEQAEQLAAEAQLRGERLAAQL